MKTKKILILIALVAFAGTVTSCKYLKRKPKVDMAAIEKAKEDSVKRAQELEAEQARLAMEQARQDSLARVQEEEAQLRFHVIIGSFKVPSNATSWEQEVRSMGYSDTRILHASNGFDLVSIAAFDTYSKAFNEIERINSDKEDPIELWIYEKM